MIFLELGSVPNGEDGVANQVNDGAAGLVHGTDGGFVVVIEQPSKVFREHSFGYL